MLPRIVRIRAVAGLAVAFAATCPVPTRADPRVVPTALDEATFLKRIERTPRRLALDDRRRAARTRIGVVSVLPNPTLSYEREAVPSINSSDDFVRLSWTVDLAGRRRIAASAARASVDAEGHDVDRETWVVAIDARLAYLDAMYARDHLARLDEARVPLAELVDALRARAKQGDAASYDADRAALELDGLDDDRSTARRLLEIARLRLGGFLGEPSVAYDAADALALPPRPDVQLVPKRSDVDAAVARALQADHDLAAARRRWIPRFQLVGGLLASTSSSGEGVGYVIGIGGELPVFDRGGAAAGRARADGKRWRSEAQAIANDATGEVARARRDLVLRIEQAEAYLAGPARRAGELRRRAAVAYREGDRPILELLDVQRGARHAALRAVELIFEARRAELALRRALGRDR